MTALSVFYGGLVGLSLGLTGGGGAIFAVPLLVYGRGIPPREAVAISLATVSTTSFIGFLRRWMLGEVELRTGLLFASAGMAGAPAGTWLAGLLPDAVLLLSFAVLMIVVAVRLWRKASQANGASAHGQIGSACSRDTDGVMMLNSRCAVLLLGAGILTGVLSGLFGVGGGFVIVPALVLLSGMPMRQAVGTSLMVIALVSLSGIASQLWSGREIAPTVTGLFVAGGILGLFFGEKIGRRLSGPLLQKVFVIAMFAVAVLLVRRNWNS